MHARRSIALLFCLILGLFTGLQASADDSVLSVVAVQVNSGQLDTYSARVAELQTHMERLGVDGTPVTWRATAAGTATGTVFVAIQYPSLASYAAGTTKSAADPEFSKLIGGLDDIRTIASNSLYRNVFGGGGTEAGTLLQTVAVKVAPGRLSDYVAELEKLQAVQQRVGSSGKMRAWQATAAGANTGNVVVGIIYPDLATYAADTAKVQADAEWEKIIGGLDGMRTIVSTGLARRVSP